MGITWDKGTYVVKNRTGSTLTLGDFKAEKGRFGDRPVVSIEDGADEDPAFSAQSKNDSRDGPVGFVEYGLPDGTLMIIRFALPDKGEIVLSATFKGARASQYSSDVTIDKWIPKGGGRRVEGTIEAKRA